MGRSFTRILLAIATTVGFAFAEPPPPQGGVPLVRGMIWTGEGIGATSLGGMSFSEDASSMMRMEGIGWYHYKPWLIAGAGYNLSMTTAEDDGSLFVSRFEIHSAMVWPLGKGAAFQLDLPLMTGNKNFYVDTLPGADPVLRSAQQIGSGLLAGVGARRGPFALSLVGGLRWAWWWNIDSTRNIDATWELQPSFSYSMRDVWPRADSLTKAWDLVVGFPIEQTPRRSNIARIHGRTYELGPWQFGIRIGLAVVL